MACFEDWGEAKSFLEGLSPEPDLSLMAFKDAIKMLLSTAGDQGLSLQDVADCLAASQSRSVHPSQKDAIAILTDRLMETMPIRARSVQSVQPITDSMS